MQLMMARTDYDGLPELILPSPYEIRTFQKGDEKVWADIINRAGDLGTYDSALATEKLTSLPQFEADGLFFATHRGEGVATACAWREYAGQSDRGQLHMVGTVPEHQGNRLAFWLSLAVIRRFEEWQTRKLILLTDDFRLAAVKTYINLDFLPVYRKPDHFARWTTLYDTLGFPEKARLSRSLDPRFSGPHTS